MNFDFVVAAFLKYSADKEPLRASAGFPHSSYRDHSSGARLPPATSRAFLLDSHVLTS
jgi:hypothetical protein